MSKKKFTAKNFLYIVVLTAFVLLGYCGIFLFSLPLTLNAMTSWILSLSFVATVALLVIVSMLRERKQRELK